MTASTSADEIKEPLPSKDDFDSIEPDTLAEVTTANPDAKPAE